MKTNVKGKLVANRAINIPAKNNKVKREFILEGLGCANCAAKIERKVGQLKGVENASLNFMSKTLALEIEEVLKVEELIAATKKIVNSIEPDVVIKEKNSAKTGKKTLILEGLDCANCAGKIEREVQKLSGIKTAVVDFVSKRLIIETEDKSKMGNILEKVNKIVKSIEPDVVVIEEEKKNQLSMDKSNQGKNNKLKKVIFALGVLIFIAATALEFSFWTEFTMYFVSYLIIGGEVLLKAAKNIGRGQVFDENFLMCIATIGAFSIKQFPEAVAVMLFYQIGEFFQGLAVDRSRKSISNLMNIRPDFANIKIGKTIKKVNPEDVNIGDIIIVKPGEKIPLDGTVIEGKSMLDTSALTGESVPREVGAGEVVLGGFINKNGLLTIEATKSFGESTVAKILDLVENASSKKAPTENFITKFARYYTPAVVLFAVALAFLPPLFIDGATFSKWLYRALVFLVVSCPCALVVSIPLGFFGGIGGASKNGILIKGGNYLEALNNVDTVVFDKTGTLTKGIFEVTEVKAFGDFKEEQLLEYAAFAEAYSNHPIATSILKAYNKKVDIEKVEGYTEISGKGVRTYIDNREILAGNTKLMLDEKIIYKKIDSIGTVVHLALDKKYIGYIVISDEIKEDSKRAIEKLKAFGVRKTVMLTGDNSLVANKVAEKLGLDQVYSELLPDQKVEKLEEIDKQKSSKGKMIFVGDGINDAPVLARADIGIAMGGVGSDAAIEAADVVIMTDEPSKIASAIKIAKRTKKIVVQNIVFALGVKIVILILGALGFATMWEAVFGDVGVALIAVLNSMRAMKVEKN